MCGFVGLFAGSSTRGASLLDTANEMANALNHRGPDDSGGWQDAERAVAFAFRRLAILDLSSAGGQPMVSPSGQYVMVFNGEVYNFEDLRNSLGVPRREYRGGSDSEVLLMAIERLGVEATLSRINGMFAIGLWDRRSSELWLIRDRLGIKPLYIGRTRRGVAFASELGALMQSPEIDLELDAVALASYLRYLYIPGCGTPFRSIRKVKPGHYFRIRNPCGPLPSPVAYWSLAESMGAGAHSRESTSPAADEAAATDSLETLIADAVKLRMIADVPVGALLSGGIDSSLVAALMQRASSQPVRTFTVGFEGSEHDESRHAREVARHLGTEHTELPMTGGDALDLVPELPAIFSEPLANPSQIPTHLVSRLARQSVVVALTGDGGDELFGGYNRYTSGPAASRTLGRVPAVPRRWLGRGLQSIRPRTWDGLGGAVSMNGGSYRLFGQKAHKLARMMEAADERGMYRVLLSAWDDPGRFLTCPQEGADPVHDLLREASAPLSLDDMLYLDQAYYLPDELLQKVDRASMSVSLEARVPLLDHRVVERSWALPSHLKIRGAETKWILRQILSRHVPRQLIDRPKAGFSVPVESWLAGPLRPWADDLLLGASPARDALFRPEELARSWRSFLGGHTELALGVWAVVMLEAWRRHWKIEGVPEPTS
jgi:asparagine synthase (glutamine-hydrolysing)